MAPGAVFRVHLNGSSPGSGYDQLSVNGAVILNGAALDVEPGYDVPPGMSFDVLVNFGSSAIGGTFAGLPEGAVFQAGGQYFSISYKGGVGTNDVLLTRVNPPASLNQAVRINSNTVRLLGAGGSYAAYTIVASTNLATPNWVSVGTTSADGSGNFIFDVTNVLAFPQRFFQILAP
jgi:fibronectin-binding autotransporter adhesin